MHEWAMTSARCVAASASSGLRMVVPPQNGRRIFLRSTHTCNHFPGRPKLPPDPTMPVAICSISTVMGFNMIRSSGAAQSVATRPLDEIGLMVYEESLRRGDAGLAETGRALGTLDLRVDPP